MFSIKLYLLVICVFVAISKSLTQTTSLINFYCANPQTKTFVQTSSNDPLIGTKINLAIPCVYITHGWHDGLSITNWMQNLGNLWVTNHNTNVCLVDWQNLASGDYNSTALDNIYIVAPLINTFIEYVHLAGGVGWTNIKCCGHSLGAHICGLVGSASGGNMLAIYGMDPAGPLFSTPVVVPISNRLDPSDAQQVVAIHTGAPIYGYCYNLGHEDIWVNYGITPQPGCIFPASDDIQSDNPLFCSHYRAIEIMMQAVVPDNQCNAVKCKNAVSWTLGFGCTDVINLSADTPHNPGTYYMATNPGPTCT